jgi:LuxR family maltose regulon positive regulatory protein
MVRVPIPLVVDEYFFLSGNAEDTPSLRVGTPEWYLWLAKTDHRSFSMRCYAGGFTARHEQQRHGWYWYAYRKRGGKSYKVYLGKSEDVTRERLYEVAMRLAHSEEVAMRLAHSENEGRRTEINPVPTPVTGIRTEINPVPTPVTGIRTEINPVPTMHVKALKFSVPSIETTIIPRPHLLSILETGRKSKVLLLSAQAGWGKTMLLSSWCPLLSRQNIPFAWISWDSYDNDPTTFWSSLITALQIIQPGLGQKAWRLLHNAPTLSLDTIQHVLMDECLSLTRECILLLDDVHHLTSPESQRSLLFFLERLPPQLHLVMASRFDPPLPLAKLRVQGKLLELRSPELALSVQEISALLRETLKRPFSAHDALLLAQQTEGWAAGVHLAALLLKGLPDPAKGLAYFSGHTRSVFDFLLEEVLLQQPLAVQDFLVQTCLLTELSSLLCDAVRISNNSQIMLEYLRQNNLFLVPVDAQELQYRYHPLFQEMLQARLRQQNPALEADLQQRALCWYEQHPIYTTKKKVQADQWIEIAAVKTRSALRSATHSQPVNLLTDRERDVLALLLHGATNREIAQHLIISEGTTKKHIANICSKFNVQRRTQVITRMLEPALS